MTKTTTTIEEDGETKEIEIEKETEWKLVDTIIWKKQCGLPFPANKRRLSRNWEFVWIFARKNEIFPEDVETQIDKEINEEFGNFDSLILDFTDVEYISSAGLRVLIATQKKLKADNIPFIIRNVNDTVGEIFRMSGFDKILKIE